MAKFRTHYDNLNVSRDAPLNVIKAAYKALCQKYHPDKYIGGHDEALRIMKAINNAYAVLSDTGKRAEHDQWIDMQERHRASNEAQRIMNIISQNYVAPAGTVKSGFLTGYRVAIHKFREQVGLGVTRVLSVADRIAKKINWSLGLAGVLSIALLATIVYLYQQKTATVISGSASQDVVQMLNKAKQLVKQGQVEKALPLYLLLAEQGNAEAEFLLGSLYANGQGVAKDEKQAADWLVKAAEQGYRAAQTEMGFMYATGKGVPKNYSLANFWCYKAAEQGDATAQYNLGLMYAEGQGVAKDNSLAGSWYGKAAAQGDARAQFRLAELYANGAGVAKDNQQAVALYKKAAQQGLAEAITALKRLER